VMASGGLDVPPFRKSLLQLAEHVSMSQRPSLLKAMLVLSFASG